MHKILISRCLLGEPVRYDGKSKSLKHQAIKKWQHQQRLIPICPEVIGGLPTPRPPAELDTHSGLVLTQLGEDKSLEFKRGAQAALSLCQQHNIKYALLKERSPSCGSSFVYDGSFSQTLVKGQGVTTKLLESEGIKVYSEETIEQLIAELHDD